MPTSSVRPRLLALAAALVAVAAIAVPVLGQATPPATEAPAAAAESEKPGNGPKSEKPGKGERKAKVPDVPVTLTGRVGTRTETDGDTRYTLTVGSTVYDLHVGPRWWWGNSDPLKGLVGDSVTIEGDKAEGTTDVDVRTVNGTVVREPGKPPWAGGWKAVGEKHPGWSQEKADRAAEKAKNGPAGRPSWAGPKPSPDSGD